MWKVTLYNTLFLPLTFYISIHSSVIITNLGHQRLSFIWTGIVYIIGLTTCYQINFYFNKTFLLPNTIFITLLVNTCYLKLKRSIIIYLMYAVTKHLHHQSDQPIPPKLVLKLQLISSVVDFPSAFLQKRHGNWYPMNYWLLFIVIIIFIANVMIDTRIISQLNVLSIITY